MNKGAFIIILLVVTSVFTYSYAQTFDEHYKKLTHHHEAIIKESEKIQDEKLAAEKMDAVEMGKHIESAQQQYAKIRHNLTPEQKEATKEHNAAIEKYHSAALAFHKVLTAELEKSYPDKVRVKNQAKKIHEAITAAENEHNAMKGKLESEN